LDQVTNSEGTEKELNIRNYIDSSLLAESRHPYASSLESFLSRPLDLSPDPIPACHVVRLFIGIVRLKMEICSSNVFMIDTLCGCCCDDFLSNGIKMTEKEIHLITLLVSDRLFSGSLFDQIFSSFVLKVSQFSVTS
jgi:hypothetical protein